MIIQLFLYLIFFINTIDGSTTSNHQTINLYVHGTKVPGVDVKRKVFGGFIPKGLHCAKDFTDENNPHEIISCLCAGEQTFCPKKDLYFFGWDGFFPSHREHEAQNLYDALLAFRSQKKMSDHDILHVHCLTHSHGGNIVLYVVQLIEQSNTPIIIDELTLMGCPIQRMTEKFAYSPIIQKLYNFYSNGDAVQIHDLQFLYPEAYKDGGLTPIRSLRRLQPTRRKNLWQVAFRMNSEKIGHFDFITPLFFLSVIQIINTIKEYEPGDFRMNLITDELKKELIPTNIELSIKKT